MAPAATRKLVYVPLHEVVPADRNPKAHDLVALRASFRRFGFVEPITEDGRTGRLVSGHGRLEELAALEALGEKPDGWDSSWPPEGVSIVKGRWAVPVVRGWSSRDDDEAEAFLVAANRITEAGGWRRGELAEMLQELAETAVGLEGTGYSGDDLDLLLAELATREPTPPSEFPSFDENIETEHECPRCKYTWSGSSTGKAKVAEAAAG